MLPTLVLREATRLCILQDYAITPELLRYLSSSETRDCVYSSCVKLVEEDQQRHGSITRFLLCYLPSFPPSRRTLRRLQNSLVGTVKKQGVYADDASITLREFIQRYLAPLKLHSLSSETTASNRDDVDGVRFTSAVSVAGSSPTRRQVSFDNSIEDTQYVKRFNLHGNDRNSTRMVSREVTVGPATEYWRSIITAVARNKDTTLSCLNSSSHTCIQVVDYFQRLPFPCDEAALRQHLHILGQFRDGYKSNRAVVQATLFLVDAVCDGYVSKLPLCRRSFASLRSISLCLLPTLLEWMESDYLCVRNHVYDFVTTLAVHLQMVDSHGAWRGCTQALQTELSWIVRSVLHRQCLVRVSDESTWSAAAKCTLAVLPPSCLPLVDVRVLLHLTRLAGLAELYPAAFTLLVKSFACGMMVDKRLDDVSASGVILDEAALMKLEATADEGSVMKETFKLYRRANMREARRALFRLLFACAVRQVRQFEAKHYGQFDVRSTGASSCELSLVLCSFEALVALDLDWHLYTLLFTLAPSEVDALTHNIIRSAHGCGFTPDRQSAWRVLTTRIVYVMLSMIANNLTAPLLSTRGTHNDSSSTIYWSTVPRFDRLICRKDCPSTTGDLLHALSLLLHGEQTDGSIHHAAWLLAYHAVLHAARVLQGEEYARFVESLAHCVTNFSDAGNARTRSDVRHVFVNLITSLMLADRSGHSLSLARGCAVLLDEFVISAHPLLDVDKVMTLYHRLVEKCLVQNGQRSLRETALLHGNVTNLVLAHGAMFSTTRGVSLGVRTWWALYRALGHDQTGSTCRARHVILLVICRMFSASHTVPLSYTWQLIMKQESYIPNAFLASIQCSAADCTG